MPQLHKHLTLAAIIFRAFMKILFLDSDLSKRDFYTNILQEICDKKDLTFYSSAQDLSDFIEINLIIHQQHVDLIISEFDVIGKSFKDILETIRISQKTYSFNNFKVSALPIVLHTNHFPTDDYKGLDVDLVIRKPVNENKNDFASKIKSLIKSWRRRIFDDLEVLGIGIDYDFNKIDVGYTVKVKADKTKILSSSFIYKQNKLPYLWLNKQYFEQETSIEELQVLVNQYLEYPRKELERRQWENQLQDFFNRNPKFIFKDTYSDFWSEPRLYYPNSKKHIKPDYVGKPIISPELGKNWQVFDLKLPIQEFLQQTEFHKSFTGKFQKCLTQIADYKEYFKQDSHKANIERVLKFHPKHPRLTLIVGRRNKLLEQQDKIHERLQQMNYADINLVTYDEILDYQRREVERLMDIKIF